MKKLFFVFLFLAVTISEAQFVAANHTERKDLSDAYVINEAFTADSAASEFYSTKFSLDGFNQTAWSTTPITISYALNTVSGTPKVIILLYGVGANNNRFALDTLGVGAGVGDTLVSTTPNKCLLKLEAGQYRFPVYQFGVRQIVTGKALTKSYLEATFIKPKNN